MTKIFPRDAESKNLLWTHDKNPCLTHLIFLAYLREMFFLNFKFLFGILKKFHKKEKTIFARSAIVSYRSRRWSLLLLSFYP